MNRFRSFIFKCLCEKTPCEACPLKGKEDCNTCFENLSFEEQEEVLNKLTGYWMEEI